MPRFDICVRGAWRLAGVTAILCAMAAAAPRRSLSAVGAVSTGTTSWSRPLPSGVHLEEPELGHDWVAVVATDIDTDGDLDIVAADDALHLYVWINDGDGHFTRRAPAQSPTWRGEPARSTIDDRGIGVELFTQNDRPSGGASASSHTAGHVVSVQATESPTDASVSTDRSVGPPRAPPAPAFLN